MEVGVRTGIELKAAVVISLIKISFNTVNLLKRFFTSSFERRVIFTLFALFTFQVTLNAAITRDSLIRVENQRAAKLIREDPDSALKINLGLYEKLDSATSKYLLADLHGLSGTIYLELEQYEQALSYLFKAYQIHLDSDSLRLIARSEYNIANTFYYSDQLEKAADYHRRSLAKCFRFADSFRIAISHNSLGMVYQDLNKMDSAAFHYKRAESYLNDSVKNHSWLANDLYCNLARFYEILDSIALSKHYLYLALEINQRTQDDYQKAWIYHHLGILEEYQQNYPLARQYYDTAYSLVKKLNDIQQMWEIERSFLNLALLNHRDSGSINMLSRFLEHGDTLQKWKVEENINRIESEFQLNQKEQELKVTRAENRSKQIRIYILVICIFFLVLLTIILIRYFRNKQKISQLGLELKNRELDELLRKQEIERVNALLKGQNKERQRIAQDLHDRLGSLLLAAKLQYQKLERNLKKALDEQYKSQEQLNMLLQEATEEVRRISHDLYEGSLAKFGYKVAINQLIKAVEEANIIKINFDDGGLDPELYHAYEKQLYRISQELLSNTLKHAEAGKIEIIFRLLEGDFVFQYRDDGRGFRVEALKEKDGIGLNNIEDRVKQIGGKMTLRSEPNKGMQFELRVKVSDGADKNNFSR